MTGQPTVAADAAIYLVGYRYGLGIVTPGPVTVYEGRDLGIYLRGFEDGCTEWDRIHVNTSAVAA